MQMLDPRSIIALGGFMALLMTVVLFFMRRTYPTPIGGLPRLESRPEARRPSPAVDPTPPDRSSRPVSFKTRRFRPEQFRP